MVIAGALAVLGASEMGASRAPLADAMDAGRLGSWTPVVKAGAALASLSVLLSLLAGVSRTAFAMARRRDLPGWLDAVHPRYGVPQRAELAVGITVMVLAATLDLRSAIGFSSFAVLFYYAIANASAWTLSASERRWPSGIAAAGLAGCAALAFSLSLTTVIAGTAVLAAGLAWYVVWTRGRAGGAGAG
jgi:APA family basic amino acid/polyamine antiporter